MKYCSHCGAEVNDEAVVCIKCGCSVSTTYNQVVGIVSPNDASSKGFAVLGFFFPLVGFILWLVWNNISPKKARSCGIGALIGVVGVPIIVIGIFATVTFLTTSSVITYKLMNKGGKQQTEIIEPSSPYIGKHPEYAMYTLIGPVSTRTKDDAKSYSVQVDMILAYDFNDNVTQVELVSRQYELRDFVRSYFTGKYAAELVPENEAHLKQDIKEILNTRFLDKARVRLVLFNKLDVMESY